MTNKKFKYIPQLNSYGCGVFAVMNAINYGIYSNNCKTPQLCQKDSSNLEKILNTDKEYGTEEKYIIDFLRTCFYVTVRRKFSKKKLDKWLEKGNQAIILYPYAGKYELHYSNILHKTNKIYYGANVWFKRSNKWVMLKTIPKELFKSMYHPDSLTIYLRWRGNVE